MKQYQSIKSKQLRLCNRRFREEDKTKELIKKAKATHRNYELLSVLVRKRVKIKLLISVRRNEMTRLKQIQSLAIYVYRNSIGNLLIKTGLSKWINRYTKRRITMGGRCKLKEVIKIKNYKKVFKKIIYFPKGYDLAHDYPQDSLINKFDIFFCHGSYHQQRIKEKYNCETFVMGYPRYCNSQEGEIKEKDDDNDWKKKKKLKILWMPSVIVWGSYNQNIEAWKSQ